MYALIHTARLNDVDQSLIGSGVASVRKKLPRL
jgi:hypothetical protein